MSESPSLSMDVFIQAKQDLTLYAPAAMMSGEFNNTDFDPAMYAQKAIYYPPSMVRASRKRQAEYFVGRYLADQAMSHFGVNQFKLLADAKRCPQWPKTLVGSITHTDNYAACITAEKSEESALGIDAQDILDKERAERLQSRIIDSAESRLISESSLSAALGLSLCFSAKESIYKGLYPQIQQYFGFNAAKLHTIDSDNNILSFRFDPALHVLHNDRNILDIRYHIYDQRVLTCLMLHVKKR